MLSCIYIPLDDSSDIHFLFLSLLSYFPAGPSTTLKGNHLTEPVFSIPSNSKAPQLEIETSVQNANVGECIGFL